MGKVTVRDGFIQAEGKDTFHVGEVVRCLSCGALAMGGSGPDDCGGPWAIYTYRHTEDHEGTQLHPEQVK